MAPKNYLEQAKTHIDRGQVDEAINNLIEHLDANFNDASALMMLGACFLTKGHAGIAAAVTKQAIEIKRQDGVAYSEALNNLGVCFKTELHTEAAKAVWQLALEVETDPAERGKLLANMAGCHIHAGEPEKALPYFDEAAKVLPDNPQLEFDRSMALMELGRWREGWQGFEAGFACGVRPVRKYGTLPIWDGTPGQTVIVWGEQGVGDEILFASCIPDMIAVCKHVIFDCHPRLVDLFARSFPDVTIHGTRKTLSKLDWVAESGADACICVASLPKFFRNEDADWPGHGFLAPAYTVDINRRKPRIGISWTGGTKKTRTDLRSIPLLAWEPILSAIDADFYSLQYTPDAAREVCELEEATGLRVRHFPSWAQAPNYDKTASFAASMDLIITVATACHHMGNALGVPTWTLCSSSPSWRYTKYAEIFYKNCGGMFFHQRKGESWMPVIDRVADTLKERFASGQRSELGQLRHAGNGLDQRNLMGMVEFSGAAK